MCSCYNASQNGESEWHFLARAFEHLDMIPLTRKREKNPKRSAIIDHILLKDYDASSEIFTILLKGSNNRNAYSYPLELFD